MRGNIELVAEHCEGEGATSTHECLRACLQAVVGRYECFGEIEQPEFFSAQQRWEHYREVVTHNAYWLSCEEAALVALLAGRSVDVYKFRMMEGKSSFELEASARSLVMEMEIVSIALEPGPEGQGGVRGHFSRIWPETSWNDHFVSVAAARARRQHELEEEQLGDHDPQSGRGEPSPDDQGAGQERGSLSRASSCSSFSSQVPCGAQCACVACNLVVIVFKHASFDIGTYVSTITINYNLRVEVSVHMHISALLD